MDLAESDTLQDALNAQGSANHRHEQKVTSLTDSMQEIPPHQDCFLESIDEQYHELTCQVQQSMAVYGDSPAIPVVATAYSPPSQPTPDTISLITLPERSSRNSNSCLIQCSLVFDLQSSSLPDTTPIL